MVDFNTLERLARKKVINIESIWYFISDLMGFGVFLE